MTEVFSKKLNNIKCKNLNILVSNPRGKAIIIENERTQTSGDLVQINGTAGQICLKLNRGQMMGGAYKTNLKDETCNNSVVLTTVGISTLRGNSLVEGNAIHIVARGRVISSNENDTLKAVLKIGSITIQETVALDVENDDIVDLDCWIQIRTIGTTGTFVATGDFRTDNLGSTRLPFTKTSTEINTTTNQNISLSVQWSEENVNNQYTQDTFIVMVH